MIEPTKNKDHWDTPASNEKREIKELGHKAIGSVATIFLTAVIIAGGFILPTLIYPYLDSYSNTPTLLASPGHDVISGHVFEDPVTLYPWDVISQAQLRNLTTYEMYTLEQSGVAEFLVSNMELRGIPLGSDPQEYIGRILNDFKCLEQLDAGQPGCFVLADADIDQDGVPDVRCAVDFYGNLMSVLFVSEAWTNLQLVTPLSVTSEQIAEIAGGSNTTGADGVGSKDASGAEGANATGSASDGGASTQNAPDIAAPDTTPEAATPPVTPTTPTTPTDSSTTYVPKVDNRPLQEEENIWQFSYVISREALLIGQMDVFSAFRHLDLGFEELFGYPFAHLIAEPSENTEVLPGVVQMAMTTHQLATGDQLLRIYDFSNGTRLILFINSSTQNCEGFSLSTLPV